MEDERMAVLQQNSLHNRLQRKDIIATSKDGKERWKLNDPSRLKVILILEKDDLVRDTIVHLLRDEGYFVLATADETLALAIAKENPLSLVLLDPSSVSLPLAAFCQQVRFCSETQSIYLVMMIMHESEIALIESYGAHADDYIKKPLQHEELCACLQTLLRTERHQSKPKPGKAFFKPRPKGSFDHNTALIVNDLFIDTAQRLVYRNDSIVDLRSSILFDLLVYLVHHRGMIVTRDQLLHDVWGHEAEDREKCNTRTLSVHIHWLRKVLDDDLGDPQRIQTVRGIGYCFNDYHSKSPDYLF